MARDLPAIDAGTEWQIAPVGLLGNVLATPVRALIVEPWTRVVKRGDGYYNGRIGEMWIRSDQIGPICVIRRKPGFNDRHEDRARKLQPAGT